jgi:hypothetical protein
LYCQWQKVFQFPGNTGVRTIYFLDQLGHSELGFAGLNNGSIWGTTDHGNTWKKLFQDPENLSISDITFKDRLTGWFCTDPYLGQIGIPGVFRTTDGGASWQNILSDPGGFFKALYYFQPQKTLYLSEWGRGGFQSGNDGTNWNLFTTQSPLNGYAFTDAKNGILTFASIGGNNQYETNDGGLSWQLINTGANSWQPAASNGAFYIFSEYTSSLVKSSGLGFPQQTISTIGAGTPLDFTGTIRISDCNGQFYVQSATIQGMFMSTDQGVTWQNTGGPSNEVDSRFWIDGVDVYAADYNGGLWVNSGIEDTVTVSPQLTIPPSAKSVSLLPGKDTTVALSFRYGIPGSAGLDSFAFDISFNSDLLGLDSTNAAAGWKVSTTKINSGLYHCVLINTLQKDIAINAGLVFFFFTTFLSKDTSSFVQLEHGTPFFDPQDNIGCTFLSIVQNSVNDAVTIQAADSCGDNAIRQFLKTGKIGTTIVAIHPNPAHDEITIETESTVSAEATVNIIDNLGRVVHSEQKFFTGKENTPISLANLPAGNYFILLSSAEGRVSSEFVKLR